MKPRFTDEHKWAVPYVSASATDIRKTLERARKRIASDQAEQRRVVTPIAKVRK